MQGWKQDSDLERQESASRSLGMEVKVERSEGWEERQKKKMNLTSGTNFGDQNKTQFCQSIFNKNSVLSNLCYTAFWGLISSSFCE